jgi:hypothetical protein
LSSPLNKESFQMIIRPPDAPTEGTNTNLLNFLGQKFLMYLLSKDSLFVSWRQIISQPLSSILFARAFHFFIRIDASDVLVHDFPLSCVIH